MVPSAVELWQRYIDDGNKACEEGRFSDAEGFYKQALFEAERSDIQEDCLALSVNNLAWVCHRQGKYAEAETLYQKALQMVEQLCGQDHPDVAIVLQCMARLYSASSRGQLAQTLLKRALDIRRKAFGEGHSEVVSTEEEFLQLLRENEARLRRETRQEERQAAQAAAAADTAARQQMEVNTLRDPSVFPPGQTFWSMLTKRPKRN